MAKAKKELMTIARERCLAWRYPNTTTSIIEVHLAEGREDEASNTKKDSPLK